MTPGKRRRGAARGSTGGKQGFFDRGDAMSLETWLLLVILVFLGLSLFARGGGNVGPRLLSLDRKLNLILENLGIDPNQGIDKQVAELMRGGQKIEAIKLYREQTGVGLKEAKDYVEGL
jgi:Ribosomal protein L7/L12 C-terminal domain